MLSAEDMRGSATLHSSPWTSRHPSIHLKPVELCLFRVRLITWLCHPRETERHSNPFSILRANMEKHIDFDETAFLKVPRVAEGPSWPRPLREAQEACDTPMSLGLVPLFIPRA
jgi:hypothetical protein